MPAEALAEPPVSIEPEQAEVKEYTAAEFVMAFASVYLAQRQAAAELMNVNPEKLNPQYVGTHYQLPEHSMSVISKVEEVMKSGLCQDRVERFADNQPGGLLRHPEVLRYLSGLSAECFAGAASSYLLENGKYFQKMEDKQQAKRKVIAAHKGFINLADSSLGELLKVDRRHLRFLANVMFGKLDSPSQIPVWFEVGVSAEIATKKALQRLAGNGSETKVRYAETEEDLKGTDIVIDKNDQKLLVDVKSSDKHSYNQDEQRAYHYRPEQVDVGVYQVRELHPASIESINDDFSIDQAYEKELVTVLQEFDRLSAGSRTEHGHGLRRRRQPVNRGVRMLRPALHGMG